MKTKVRRVSKRTLAIFLGVIMLVSCLVVGQIPTATAADCTSVSLFNTSSWANPKAYVWNASDNGWPGQAMNQDLTFSKLYSYSWNETFTKCIFSDNGNRKTGDLSPSADDSIYSIETNKFFSKTRKSFYIKNTQNWSNLYVDLRDDSDNRYVKNWPGVKVLNNTSTTDGEGYYSVTSVGNDTYKVEGYFGEVTKIILHDYSGHQTPDTVSFVEDKVYDSNGDINNYEQLFSVSVTSGSNGKIKVGDAAASASQTATVGSVTTATVTAVPDTGYQFDGWTKSSSVSFASGDASSTEVTINANASGTLSAAFSKKSYTVSYPSTSAAYTIKGSSNSSLFGETESVLYDTATSKFKVAAASAKYRIDEVYYTEEGSTTHHTLSADGEGYYKISNMPAKNVQIAVDVTNMYTITFGSNNTDYGTVTSNQGATGTNVAAGTSVTFTAAEDASGKFVGWYGNAECTGAALGTSLTYTTTVNADTTVYGKFVNAYNLTLTKKGDGSGTFTINGNAAENSYAYKTAAGSVTVVASEGSGYSFAGWYSDEDCTTRVSTSKTYTFTLDSATTLYADFEYDTYYLSGYVRLAPWGGGSDRDYRGNVFGNTTADSRFLFHSTDASNPNIFTCSMDIYGDQYLSVTNGTDSGMYAVEDDGAEEGTVALPKTTFIKTTHKWKADIGSEYKTITYIWDSVAKTLSWDVKNIADMRDYAVMYVKASDAYHTYVWSTSGDNTEQPFLAYPGKPITNFQKIVVGDDTYYVILLSAEQLAAADSTFNMIINNGGTSNADKSECDGIEVGTSYKIEVNSLGTAPTVTNNWTPTRYAVTLSDQATANKVKDASINADLAYENDSIIVTARAKAGYAPVVTAYKNGDHSVTYPVTRDTTKFTFTMPANAVDVEVTYETAPLYDVKIVNNEGGTIVVTDVTDTENPVELLTVDDGTTETIKVTEGDRIKLFSTPASGYTLSKWQKGINESYSTSAELSSEEITGKVTYVCRYKSSSVSGVWPPEGITTDTPNNNQLIYNYASDSTHFLSDSRTSINLAYNSTAHYWWIDLTDYISDIKNATQGMYFSISNNGELNGIWQNKAPSVDTSNAPGINANSTDAYSGNTQYHFAQIQKGIGDSVTKLGLKITDDGKFNYTLYTLSSGTSDNDYSSVVTYYAKDAAIRDNSVVSYLGSVQTEVQAVPNIVTVNARNGKRYLTGKALKGEEITVTTTISGKCGSTNVDAKDKYFVKGFSFNGETPEILEERADGVYTCTYKIKENMKENVLEITPIYFLKSAYANNAITFYINGYDDTVKTTGKWGNTLFIYPYYRYKKNDNSGDYTTYRGQAEAFGRYPGQPVINYGGILYTQIPLTDDGTATGLDGDNPIKGMTINNGRFDDIHYGQCGFVSDHRQTYDFDDFQKIAIEKKEKDGKTNLSSIFFDFKYETGSAHRPKTGSDKNQDNFNDPLGSTINPTTTYNSEWEDLTDAYGRKVDIFGNAVHGTHSDDETLYVVSLGYEYNNAGKYATEWVVYYNDNGTYRKVTAPNSKYTDYITSVDYTAVVPSALVMNDVSSFDNYQQMDDDMSIHDFYGMYTELSEYAGRPVKIAYEREQEAGSDEANRCDGRWTYTTVNDKIQANIEIEYYDKSGTLQTDTIPSGSHTGDITKTKAYFTNTQFAGETVSDKVLVDSGTFTFQAEEAGAYEFEGWYTKDTSGKYKKINNVNDDLSSESPMATNVTFVARFKYVSSGILTISHNADPASSAETYLGVAVTNTTTGDTKVLADSNNTKAVKINKDIIKSGSPYNVTVTIRTVANGENVFSGYSAKTTDATSGTASNCSNSNIFNSPENKNSREFTFSVSSDIFTGTDMNYSAIEYISHVATVQYKYQIKYSYNSRSYGTQSFKQKGSLNAAQIGNTSIVTGTKNKDDKKLTSEFLSSKIPHESNFNKKITWDCDSAASGAQTCEYDSTNNIYTIIVNVSSSVSDDVPEKHVTFSVPYAVNETTKVASDVDSNGFAAKLSENTSFSLTTDYGTLLKVNEEFITAPKQLTGENVTDANRFFQYWEIKNPKGKVVAKCFYPKFNYVIYEDYKIEAKYGSTPNFADLYNSEMGTTISFIGNTRNQWNVDKGTAPASAASGDLIYNDFILSFKSGEKTINSIDGAQAGFVIQMVKRVELDSKGEHSKTLEEYAADYSDEQLDAAREAAQKFVGGTNTSGYTQLKKSVDPATVNDKNREHVSYAMYEKYKSTSDDDAEYTVSGLSRYLYRAYSYMIIDGTTYISETPAYFCMYDIEQL